MLLMPAAQAPQVGVSALPLGLVARLNTFALQRIKLCLPLQEITLGNY